MKDEETKKIYLHATVAFVITLLAVIFLLVGIHDWRTAGLDVFYGLLIWFFVLVVTSSVAG